MNIISSVRSFKASKVKTSEKGDRGQSISTKEGKGKKMPDGKAKDSCTQYGFRSHLTKDGKIDLQSITCIKCAKKGHAAAICQAKLIPTEPRKLFFNTQEKIR